MANPTSAHRKPEKTIDECLLHRHVFTVAKQFKKLCPSDQKMLFQFVDTFFPPNHGFYFLIREILQTGSKSAKAIQVDDGIGDNLPHNTNYPENSENRIIHSVRDYSSYLSVSASVALPKQNNNKSHLQDTSSSDFHSDSEENVKIRQNGPRKKTAKNQKSTKQIDTETNIKKRNIYRLLNSTSANAVERHYDRALYEEQAYLSACQSYLINHHESKARLLVVHQGTGLHCNNITGDTRDTAEQWRYHADSRIRHNIQYTICYPHRRDESEEADIHPPPMRIPSRYNYGSTGILPMN